MDAESIFSRLAHRQGWSEASQIDVLLRYIENQGSPDAFQDFLEGQAAEENASGDAADEIHPGWTTDDADAAEAEGWNLFSCGDGELVIEASHDAENRTFADAPNGNMDAHAYVELRAVQGSALHRRALAAVAAGEPVDDDDDESGQA